MWEHGEEELQNFLETPSCYHPTIKLTAEYSRKVLFSRNVKPGMFGLGIVQKETFLAYSTQLVFLIIRLVPGNAVMVAIDICRKIPMTGEWIYGIT